jgi:hypothetical protein
MLRDTLHELAKLLTRLCQGSVPYASHQPMKRSTAFEPASKRRKGFPSETNVRHGEHVVHGVKELIERLGRNGRCRCGSGRRFQVMLLDERTE